jgi:serine/threonine protein kinase
VQGLVVLPDDVQIVPLSELPPSVRTQVDGEDGDFALTRPLSRTPSKVIGSNAAALLQQFRDPKTIVAGILAYSKAAKARPSDVLEEAYPLIESCLFARLLVEPGTESEKIRPCFAVGDLIGDNTIERSIQALIDSEVYQVRTGTGRLAALKIARPNAIQAMRKLLDKEAELLRRIGGTPAPDLLGAGELEDGRPYLLVEWFDGDDANSAVQKINECAGPEAPGRGAELCASVIDAYATLHERGVVHADVHPRNVLVSESGEVRIIDFGIACALGATSRPTPRAGVAFFFEPEYAQSIRAGSHHVAPGVLGEQYSVAALVYCLLCGKHYLDFSFDKEELLRQIAEDKPLSFERRDASHHAALEPVVLRALHKHPAERFETTRQFAGAFRAAMAKGESPAAVRRPSQEQENRLLDRVLAIIRDPGHTLEYARPSSPTASVTYGAAGIAYAAYRIACAREDVKLFALADAWAERSSLERGEAAFYHSEIQITPETVGRISPYHTASGVAAVQALLSNARCDTLLLDAALNRYLHLTSEECVNPDLTLGQASVLHGLTLMLESCGPERPPALVDRGNQLCAGLHALIEREPAIGEGGTISYLGIAHGWAGILHAALRWWQLTGEQPAAAVEVRLRQLAACARLTRRGARWPVQAGPGSITLAGWCNGSAGYAHLWTLAHRIYGDALYLDLAEKSAMDAFEGSGGGHALCCGFAGQAYAQLSLYKLTGTRLWLEQARMLTAKASALGNATLSRGDEGLPHSLYKGDVGVAVLIAELERPELAAMPFFEAEG